MTLTYDQISAVTNKKYIPKLVDNIFDSNPLMSRAKSKGWYESVDGGTVILIPLNYAQTSASGWYSGADTLSTLDNDQLTAAEYSWKQMYANISISRLDELKNMGDSQVLDFVQAKVQIAEKTMQDTMGTGLYNAGSTANQIVGLRAIVGTANTVGGIDQSANSWWRGQVDSTTTTLSLSAIQTVWNLCTIDNDSPTVGMATRSIYNSYYGLLQPQQRFMDSDAAKGGFASLMFNGIPIIADSHAPSSHLFLINEKYLHLKYHSKENFRFEDFQKPINQNVKVGKVYWAGALASSNNRLHGKLSAITA